MKRKNKRNFFTFQPPGEGVSLVKAKAKIKEKKLEEKLEAMTEEEKADLPPPVSLEIGSITKNGDIEIKFNQELTVPDFIKAVGGGCK